MAQDTTPAIVVYRGNGDNAVPYDVPFDKGYYGEVKVLFIRRGLADYTYNPTTYTVNGRLYAWGNSGTYVYTHTPNPAVGASTYDSSDVQQANNVSAVAGQTITVNSVVYTRAVQHDIANQLLLTWTGTVLTSDDFICIARETERGQPYIMPNNQKHIENALDNIERQVQEVAKKADNALLVDPTWADVADGGVADTSKMSPIDWMKSIIRCMDFSVRALRYANGWLDYSLDDPNIASGSKTWYHLLNTDNIKSVRERTEIIDGVEHYWVEYLTQNNEWRKLMDSNWESRLSDVEAKADNAYNAASTALQVAGQAEAKADLAVTYATQAQDAAANIYTKEYVFTMTAGQSTINVGESLDNKNVNVFWNGQLITKTGNWSVSGSTITLSFPIDAGDIVVVMVGVITKVTQYMSLDAHNNDPLAHAVLFNHIDFGVL